MTTTNSSEHATIDLLVAMMIATVNTRLKDRPYCLRMTEDGDVAVNFGRTRIFKGDLESCLELLCIKDETAIRALVDMPTARMLLDEAA